MWWINKYIKDPVARILFHVGVRANWLTVFGLIPCIAAAFVLVAVGNLSLAGVLFALASLADLFDGALARLEKHHDYQFGGWLDTVVDRVSEMCMVSALVVFFVSQQNVEGTYLAVAALATGTLVTYIRAAAGQCEIDIDWKGESQLLGRPGRVVILSLGMIATVLAPDFSWQILSVTLYTLNGLNVGAIIYRLNKVIMR